MSAPTLVLSPDEIRLVMAHRNMSAEIQRTTLRMAEHCAVDPLMARRKVPVFRLIAGGAA